MLSLSTAARPGKAWLGNLIALVFGVYGLLAVATTAYGQVSNFQITVPHKASPQIEIGVLKITVSITTNAPVTFTLTPPAPSTAVTTLSLSPGAVNCFSGASPSCAVGPPFVPFPAGALPDTISIQPPTVGVPEPEIRKYVILLNLDSDLNAGCVSTMTADETWTISVAAPQQIDGVCVQSLDRNTAGACGATLRVVPLTEPIAQVGGLASPLAQGCRPGADVVLVLDRSGSMNSAISGGPNATLPKISSLRSAVSSFGTVWSNLRSNETSLSASPPLAQSPTDRLGIVFFDHEFFWLKDIVGASAIDGLKDFSTLNITTETDSTSGNVKLVPPRGATSIGGGLRMAANAFTPLVGNGNRKVILLMSDGMQNTNPLVQADLLSTPKKVQTKDGVASPVDLPNLSNLKIYSVTVGAGAAISPTINQDVARATGGFYINSEVDPALLNSFFLEVLQNFIKYSTVETFRIISATTPTPISPSPAVGGQPYQTTMPVTTTTQNINFHLNWNPNLGPVRLTVQPPAGAAPIVRTPGSNDISGILVLNVTPEGGLNLGGNWGVKVESLNGRNIPFNLFVLGDDAGLNSEQITISADYAVGDQIRVQAKVNQLERPITGLSSQPGAKMLVQLLRPGVSLGDLLSSSTITPGTPTSPDPTTSADAKLQKILAENPNALGTKEDTLTLVDNGNSANGDTVAGDGIYSALFPAQLEGHYNFLFALEGATQKLGRFSRQQLKTVHVRTLPDSGNTQVQSAIQVAGEKHNFNLVVNFTPRTKFGNHVGPGWANYFWLTAPGITPVKPVDNLNGTYTARIPFTGATPSPVQIHFLRVSTLIDDSVTPGNLPVSLDNSNTVMKVPLPGSGGRFGISLHSGANFPHGDFNKAFDPGFSFTADLEYRVTNNFSLEMLFGYNRFRNSVIGPDLNLYNVSGNAKYYFGSGKTRPFFNFGGGAYRFNPGDTRGGGNVGFGSQHNVTSHFALEGAYNFHAVSTPGTAVRFSTLQFGIRVRP